MASSLSSPKGASMESRDYQRIAPSTATLDHEAVTKRFDARSITFIRLLLGVVDACDALEKAKKHFLYGKDPVDLPISERDRVSGSLSSDTRAKILKNFDLVHGAIGIATEAGELLQQVTFHLMRDGGDLDHL